MIFYQNYSFPFKRPCWCFYQQAIKGPLEMTFKKNLAYSDEVVKNTNRDSKNIIASKDSSTY